MTPPLRRGGAPLKRAGKRVHRGTAPSIALQITTSTLGAMEEGVAIAAPGFPLSTINGGFQIYTWEKLAGPSWMTVNGSGATGRVLGTPPAGSEGNVSLTVKVTTTDGQTFTKVVTGVVDAATPDLGISTNTFGTMTNGVAIAAPGFAIQAVNGIGPFTWAKVSGPSWATVDTAVTARTGRVLGTPNAIGAVTVRVRVTDSLGESFEKDITGTVDAATGALDITTDSLGTMVEATAITSPGFLVQSINGTGTHVWAKVSGPSWLSLSASSTNQVRVVGTPPEGSAGSINLTVSVTANGVTKQKVITGTVDDNDTSTFVGYYDRRIGFTKNNASEAKVVSMIDLIASGTGGNRIVGGLVRWDMGGTVNGGINNAHDSLLTAIKNKGVWGAPILGYTEKTHQRRLHFDGEINASKQLLWKDGSGGYRVGTGILPQMGSKALTINGVSYPSRVPSAANNYYRGPPGPGGFYGNGMSIHGPGIPYLMGHPVTITNGSNVLATTLPTGDNEGANCGSNWVGQEVICTGVPSGTKVAAVIAGGLRMDKNATASGSRFATIALPGNVPFKCNVQISGSLGLVVEPAGKLTAGASGTYWVGGTNASLDQKMWYDDPRDFQTVCYNTIRECNVPVKRVKRAEQWNEMPWGMGARPMASIPRAAQLLCHAYVGIKLADPSVIVCLPGPGHTTDSTNAWLNAPDWYDALLNYWYNVEPNYFADLLAANGLSKARAPKIPGEEAGMHPYSQNPASPTDLGMRQTAEVFNMIGAASGGVYLPIALTEQGVDWNRAGTGGKLAAAPAYANEMEYFDLMHGNIPWGNNTHLLGPGTNTHLPTGDGTGGTITLTSRRAKMRQVFSCATMFALQPPPDSPDRGIGYNLDGSQKYVLDTQDVVHALRSV